MKSGRQPSTAVQFGVCRGQRLNRGWRFTLTDPLLHLGVDRERLQSGERAIIRFDDVHQPPFNGVCECGVDLPDGRTDKSIRSVSLVDRSLTIRLTNEMAGAIVESTPPEVEERRRDNEGSAPHDISEAPAEPVIEPWCGDGVLSLRPIKCCEIMYSVPNNMDVYGLPDQMREDYIAVVVNGKSVKERATERDLETMGSEEENSVDPKHYISRVIDEAKSRIGEIDAGGSLGDNSFSGVETTDTFRPVERVNLHQVDSNRYQTHISKSVRAVFSGQQLDQDCAIYIDQETPASGTVVGVVLSGEDVPKSNGSKYVRKVSTNEGQGTHTVTLHQDVVSEFAPDETQQKVPVCVYVADGAIAFQRPQTVDVSVRRDCH